LKADNCKKDENYRVKLLNSSLGTNENCDLVVSTCIQYQPFKTAKLKVKAKKNNKIMYTLAIDLCSNIKPKNDIEKMILKAFGLEGNCNLNETTTICRKEKKFLLYSNSVATMISLFKSTNEDDKIGLDAVVTHENGKSCLQLEAVILAKFS
jgi:hypothetical protein